ncbi:hypothetical protein [Aliarcobacter vitoriensis]|uniref:Molybdopterin-containing oxidoreductase I, DMSO/TMAO/BSO reductase family, monoheme c-type cytochrome n=1 Tax=Aliarcobacter vitoriensis TaxID=2011099 RepID=A0A366MWD8_9BACT|nr:hypothetical protein [Aliarcobacter vitoriensis]RBQ29914.1 hypothetical protein CRU91_01150 [Aliarcobacter vitoriensis]
MKVIKKILISLLVLGSFSLASSSDMFLLENAKADFDGKNGEIFIGTPIKIIKDIDDKMVLVEISGVSFGDELYSSKGKALLVAKKDGSFVEKNKASELGFVKVEAKIEKSYLTKNVKEVWEEYEEFYYDMCTSCHAGHRAVTHTMLEWEAILQTMKGFAQLNDKEENYILRYLKANSKDGFYEKRAD